MNFKWLSITSGVALLLAILNGWPYGYYILLRWLVFGTAIYNAIGFYKSNLPGWTFIFGAVAFIFNPTYPIYMAKSSWISIDFLGSILFFLAAYSYKKDK